MKNKKAFTLVELLAVIIILAIIVVFATPIIGDTVKKSKHRAGITDATLIYKEIVKYCDVEDTENAICTNKMMPEQVDNIVKLGDAIVKEIVFDEKVVWLKIEKDGQFYALEDNAMVPYDETKAVKYGFYDEINVAMNKANANLLDEDNKNSLDKNVLIYKNGSNIVVNLLNNTLEHDTTEVIDTTKLNVNGFNVSYDFTDKSRKKYYGFWIKENSFLSVNSDIDGSNIEISNSPSLIQMLFQIDKNGKLDINGGNYSSYINKKTNKSISVVINNNFGEINLKDTKILSENHFLNISNNGTPECMAIGIFTHGKTKISGDSFVRGTFNAIQMTATSENIIIDGGVFESVTGSTIHLSNQGISLENSVRNYIRNATIQEGKLKEGYSTNNLYYSNITIGGGSKSNYNKIYIDNCLMKNNSYNLLFTEKNNEHDNEIFVSNSQIQFVLPSDIKIDSNKIYFGKNTNVSDEYIKLDSLHFIKTNEIYN